MFANCPLKKFSIISSVPEEKSFDSMTENYYENNNNTNQIFSQGINKVKTMNSYKSLFSNKNLHIIYDFSNKNNKNNFKPSSKYNKNDIIINNNSLTISEIKKYESFSEKINLYKDMIFFTKLLNQHKKNTKIIIINILLISLPLSPCVIVTPNPILKFLS